jgi:prevent-host-death family protein
MWFRVQWKCGCNEVNEGMSDMLAVGIRDLKSRLSAYIARVKAGERIIVTERGKPVAELIPISPERRALEAMVEQGKLHWSGGKPAGLQGVAVEGESVADAVIEDRR